VRTNRDTVNAFTLIELLLVVAIIGILAALLLPSLSKSKSYVRSSACKSNLRQMGQALQMYVHEHENSYPYYCNPYDPSLDAAVGAANTRYWWAKLVPYYPLTWMNLKYHCPGYKGAITGEQSPQPPFGSYAYNEYGVSFFANYADPNHGIDVGMNPNLGLGRPTFRESPSLAVSETQIKLPSEMFAIGESRFLTASVNGNPGGYDVLTCGWLNWKDHAGTQELAFDQGRHGNNYNQLFCDNHVAAINPWVLFNPTNTAPMWNRDHKSHPELWIPNQ